MAKDSNKLSEKQRCFVNAYLGNANGSATEAAKISGYKQPHSQGPRLLLENVGVKKEIERRQKISNSKAIMTRKQRQERLTELAAPEPYLCQECGGQVPFVVKGSTVTKAIDVLNKMDGEYVTKIETVNKSIIVEIDVTGLNDTELKNLDKLLAKLEAFNK